MRRLVEELQQLPEPGEHALLRLRRALLDARAPRPTGVVLTPLRALAIATALVLSTSAVWYAATRAPTSGAAAPENLVAVQFVFVDAGAARVALVGDFNDWDPAATPLTRSGAGLWSAVVAMPPGRVEYSFIVDERRWYADPNALVNTSDFDRPSSVLFVSQSESSP